MDLSAKSPGFAVDSQSHTIRFDRKIHAPRAQVFESWTNPEQVAVWWDPTGERLVVCEIDLRPGGAFSFASRSHTDMPFSGVYREIAPPERLVFEAMGAVGRVLLTEAAGATHLQVEIVCRSKEHLEQFVQMGVHLGTAQTLDNLVGFVEGSAALAT